MFSKACEYSIRASIYIAVQSMEGKRSNLKDISTSIDSPEAFTAKLLQQLVRHEIIESVKGNQGGFEIKRKRIKHVKLSDIVQAIDGDKVYKMCGLGLKDCSEKHPCPVHNKYKKVRNGLKSLLEKTSLDELTKNVSNGKTTLKI